MYHSKQTGNFSKIGSRSSSSKTTSEKSNAARIDHTYAIGDKVMIRDPPNRKHGADYYKDPCTVTKVNDNGTVELRRDAARGGALTDTWNIRNLYPYRA